MVSRWLPLVWVCSSAAALAPPASADDAQDLAKKLSNPVASLISVPFQYNYNRGIGPVEDGNQSYVNIQPVIPISLDKDWNLISRTILPVVDQHDIFPLAGDQLLRRAFSSRRRRQDPAESSGVWARSSSSQPGRTSCSAARSGAPVRQPSRLSSRVPGQSASSPITSGHSPAQRIAPT
jgi:hypothetical protein